MEWFEALILGLIQGLTEYLPVSSSGHLAIGSALFGIEGEENLAFTIVVHIATVFSTLVVLWGEIAWIFKGLFKGRMNDETRYVINIVVSMIPVGIVGVFFKDEVEAIFGSGLLVVGCCLLLTALLLTFSYYYKPRQKASISMRDAFIIGLAQACAVFPHGDAAHPGTGVAGRNRFGPRRKHCGRHSRFFLIDRFHSRLRVWLLGLQVDDKHCEERQADLFCCLLCHCRIGNAHTRLTTL